MEAVLHGLEFVDDVLRPAGLPEELLEGGEVRPHVRDVLLELRELGLRHRVAVRPDVEVGFERVGEFGGLLVVQRPLERRRSGARLGTGTAVGLGAGRLGGPAVVDAGRGCRFRVGYRRGGRPADVHDPRLVAQRVGLGGFDLPEPVDDLTGSLRDEPCGEQERPVVREVPLLGFVVREEPDLGVVGSRRDRLLHRYNGLLVVRRRDLEVQLDVLAVLLGDLLRQAEAPVRGFE